MGLEFGLFQVITLALATWLLCFTQAIARLVAKKYHWAWRLYV